MKILIDTHILLYALDDKNALTNLQKLALLHKDNHIYVSELSLMEIAIKIKIGKLITVNTKIEEFVESITENGFGLLPLQTNHIETYLEVPFYENHRDPFDRFIIAAAKFEGMTIMTNDSKFSQYQDYIQLWK